MTVEQAQDILQAARPASDSYDLETYLYGPDDADHYFATFETAEELIADFEGFTAE